MNRRKQLIQQAQRRIIELAAQTPVFTPIDLNVVQPNVKNIFPGRLQEPAFFEEVWLDQ